ncbi:hypothetical protein BP6252_11901 [Coleophoma cylindrospora]|uniref:Maleylacetoacetate isomerase n=1 Tax=Coleophoma cylindrospora TaxID=1849047 RepID=A0A3D8QL79_9HELO|nr:hypothetical protein BP6252_11901 [Coleophoma cylindrospora]
MTSSVNSYSADTLHMYSYFRSSCSGRLRIATALKGLPVKYTYVNLLSSAQKSPSYVQDTNPSGSVPTLELISPDQIVKVRICQSTAALEFLDEAYPESAQLLPADPESRATVRTLVQIINSDVQPVTNLRIMKRVKCLGGDPETWNHELITDGLKAYESICKKVAGKYSVGDSVTIADCCLVPAVWGAQRVKVDFSAMPTLWAVFERLSELEEVKNSHWKNQADTPKELRN